MAVFKQRRGTAAALAAANETPAAGQIIVETDTNRLKIGDGVTAYNALPYSPAAQLSDVTGLTAALDAKANASHQHFSTDISDFTAAVVAAAPATTNASLLTSGTVNIGRLPTGATASTVCVGNDSRLVSDGNKGDITVSGSNSSWQINAGAIVTADLANSAVTTAKIADGSITDAKITSAGLSTASLNWAAIAPWAANTAYAKGDLVSFDGVAYRRSVAGSSGATFVSTNWQQITPSSFVASQIASGTIDAARLPAYGNISTAGAIGTTSGLPLITGASGVINVGSFGSTAGTFCAGDDARLSNARTPVAHSHVIADTTGLQAALDGKQPVGTYATLVGGTVPASQLPSYVDDVLEYANTAAFPATGETGKIYVTTGDNRTYRWSGSTYVEISASPGSTDAVPEGSTNLYYTNVRAAAAAPVQSVAGRSGNVVLAVADVSGAVASSDSRLTDARTPTDGSVTTAKLASSLVVDGNALTLRFRRNTLAAFTAANPTAALGELLYETDTNRVKVGDGVTAYTALAYLTTGGGGGGGGTSPASVILDSLAFDGVTTSFTIRSGGTAVTPTSAGNLIISLNGVIQQPNVSYTVAGSGIAFSVAPAATDSFFGVLIGGNVPHASTHATGGSDALSPADIGASAVGHAHAVADIIDAASLPTTGLTITKTGDWASQNPVQVFVIVPAQAVQFGSTYTRYSGKWITSWSYSETNWAVTGGNRVSSLSFDDLQGFTGFFVASNMAALTTLSFPTLSYVGNNFNPATMAALTTLSLPALSYVGGNFNPTSMAALTTLSLPALSYVGGSFTPANMAALTTLSFPTLSYVGSNFTPATMAALTTLSFPTLSYVGNNFNPTTMAALTTLSLPTLSYVGGNFNPTAMAALANVTLPTNGTLKTMLGNVTMTGMALTAISVDNILQSLASLDGTNSTAIYGTGRTVDLSGGTSSAPSAVSSTTRSGASFVCSGTTCTVNWTAHGYATGDVLRISGITTATNANRYAVITVVNANQFTYTITSQTATGAGTATVVLAGASAKALVTRGVTLTTN